MHRTITHRYFYPHPAETVWEYLTRPELIAQWLMENDFQPVAGHEFTFRTRPLPNFEFDGTVYCKVLEIVPLQRLVYSWKGGPGKGKINLDSVVTWTLRSVDNGTELLLEHSGLMENADIFAAMNTGWLKNITTIDQLLQTPDHGNTNR